MVWATNNSDRFTGGSSEPIQGWLKWVVGSGYANLESVCLVSPKKALGGLWSRRNSVPCLHRPPCESPPAVVVGDRKMVRKLPKVVWHWVTQYGEDWEVFEVWFFFLRRNGGLSGVIEGVLRGEGFVGARGFSWGDLGGYRMAIGGLKGSWSGGWSGGWQGVGREADRGAATAPYQPLFVKEWKGVGGVVTSWLWGIVLGKQQWAFKEIGVGSSVWLGLILDKIGKGGSLNKGNQLMAFGKGLALKGRPKLVLGKASEGLKLGLYQGNGMEAFAFYIQFIQIFINLLPYSEERSKSNKDEKNDVDKVEDVMLPGFRFHPTDEGFYLKKKIQQTPLPIELIKQVDIYKHEPWDLPKPAASGEKEWYFYCPRDRKYRNSARPNRVTEAGFWKATGTDRPIYSSDGTECIGLKKSLVFYRGRAAKGIKTDWMMHEFRLPSLSDSTPPNKLLNKSLPANDAWAICKIFKKTNSMAQKALSHSWISSFPETTASDILHQGLPCTKLSQFSSENISCRTEMGSAIQLCSNSELQQVSNASFSAPDIPSYKSFNPTVHRPTSLPVSNGDLHYNFMFSRLDHMLLSPPLITDVSKASDSIDFGGQQHQYSGFLISLTQDMQGNTGVGESEEGTRKNSNATPEDNRWGTIQPIGFPFSLSPNLPWDSPQCPSEMSTTYSTDKCYT
ncbi:uncharacterized protein LOC111293394 [Durio zibethinus]|uniref:Uncharacterized protein LOC111293394 n=1 Tax=Durio zibethinus TaxID=66656 RepID=A0A6P5YNL1_DURZI|nr:uncharacterized protein LOC111293394 [Durio zibethinus]